MSDASFNSAEPLIRCRGVKRGYGPATARTVALAGVDLDVPAGQTVAIVGPSGSGKSTLLHLIGAMEAPDEGEVRVDGRDVTKLADDEVARFRREKVGFVFQFFNLIPTLSSLDNVALPARMAGRGAAESRAKARTLLERVGLGERAESRPDALSGGQQQRVAIARALINNPRIVLADEPTGALDTASGEAVLKLLLEIVRERGTTLLMATHSEQAVAHAERRIRVEDGRIVADERRAP